MSKFFKEEETQKFLLSEYLEKDSSEFKGCIFDEKSRQARTKYLIETLGDISLDEDTYKLFIKQFQSYGGRYDVRVKPETLQGIYEITEKYPSLTATAIDEIWFVYIKDLFEEYSLLDILEKYIEVHGKTDDALQAYLDFIDRKADEHQKKYEEDALRVDELKDTYSKQFVSHIKALIKRAHYSYDDIKKCLPTPELISTDEKHLSDISARTRIFTGCCEPVSYTMLDILLEDQTLDTYPETPTYYISSGRQVQATFTKQEFLDSIRKQASTTEAATPKQLKKI